MPLKTVSFLVLATALAAFLGWQQSRGAFEPADRGFVTWLAANSNQASLAPPRQVVLVRLDDEKRETFEDWPLTRLDYAVVFNNLKERKPAVLGVAPALTWPQVDEFGTGLLKGRLEAFPKTTLGYRLAMGRPRANPPAGLSPLSQIAGDLSLVPAFNSIQLAPESGLAEITPAGFTHPSLLSLPGDDQARVALLAKFGGDVVPSLALQVITASLEATTPDDIDALLGAKSRIKIGGFTLPVDAAGAFSLPLDKAPPVIRLNAETLIDAAQDEIVIENLDPAQRIALSQLEDAVVIVGDDSPAARIHQLPNGTRLSTAALIAKVAAAVLSGGRAATPWPQPATYAYWAALIGLGAFLMRFHKRRIVFCAAIAFVVHVATALLIFQSTRSWTPPIPPVTLIAFIPLWGVFLPVPKTSTPDKS